MSLVGGVHHVSLDVADAEAAVAFYEGVLGLTRIERPDFGFPGAWLDAGGTQVHLLQDPNHQARGGGHVAFRVEDIDAVVARLVESGVEVGPASDGAGGAGRQTFLRDPSGNLIELNEPLDAG